MRAFAQPPDSTRLLVSGSFPYVFQDSLRANNIAWWDGVNWSIEGLANGNGSTFQFGYHSPTFSLAIRSDTIFAGHLSDYWHEDSSMGFAAMLADGSWQPCAQPNGSLYFLEANGRMFSGGVHDELYGSYAPGIHEWVGGLFQTMPNMPFTDLVQVNDAAYWHGKYYFGGVFQTLGCNKIIAFDGVDQWMPLGTGVGGSFIRSICGYGDSLYVGGYLQPGPDVQSRHLQIWDGQSWLPFFDEVAVVGQTMDIQVYGGNLYFSGAYLFPGDTTQYGLLRYDGHQLCALGGYMIHGGGVMAFFQDDLYMALPPLNTQLYYEFIGFLDLETVVPDRCVAVTPNSIGERSTPHPTLRVYPNPTVDALTVQLPVGVHAGQLLVHDGLGRLVLSEPIQCTGWTELSTTALAPGTYTVTLNSDGVRAGMARFTKF
ncbi:MAG TPA: T9SS type A sorting domain-containing protein [Flavobacteriales bacterium]|nr:T9SS type A sorting domain-containing protein [Flavobacteriales bacterium]